MEDRLRLDQTEEEIRCLPKEFVIKRITELGASADIENESFDIYDQLLACESLAESHPEYISKNNKLSENHNPNGNDNDTYKLKVKFTLNESKLNVIQELKTYTHKTPIYVIADSLQILFYECESKSTHWNYIAEHYSPRTINWVIDYMIKNYNDWSILRNPASYFTKSIKFRKKRKVYGYQ